MFNVYVATAILALSASIFALVWSRQGLYRRLGRLQEVYTEAWDNQVTPILKPGQPLPGFAQRLARIENALEPSLFEELAREIGGLVDTERSYLPSHKKGGTVAFETLCERAPKTIAFYRSERLLDLLSGIVGARVQPTPINDQSSCSVLFYERPGDHIGWHYDHNFYRGRHFTVLIPIVNTGNRGDGLSAARLEARLDGKDMEIVTRPNTLIVFEGQKVLHRVTPIGIGERRVVLSMTFATDPSASVLQGVKRRIKDMAFFGPRALWT